MGKAIEISANFDSARLRNIKGEVRFDEASRAVYATDASNYRQIPYGVVLPKTIDDVIQVVSIAREQGIPILTRGAGTSIAGQSCNEALVIDFSKYMNQILEVNVQEKSACIQPGVVLDDLQKKLEGTGLRFGPDPSTHSRCTLGGMIGNDSCGVHSLYTGRTSHNTLELTVLTYDGLILRLGSHNQIDLLNETPTEAQKERVKSIREDLQLIATEFRSDIEQNFPRIPRRVSGYSIDQLLPNQENHIGRSIVGSEGTCVILLEAKVKLSEYPEHTKLLVAGFPSIFTAADLIKSILDFNPIGLEGFDSSMTEAIRTKGFYRDAIAELPEGNAWLLIELGDASAELLEKRAESLVQKIKKENPEADLRLTNTDHEAQRVWKIREFGPGASVFAPGKKNGYSGWEDSAVDPCQLGSYLRDLKTLFDRYGYEGGFYGHFGDGCVHVRISFDFESREGMRLYREFIDEAADLVLKYDGSFSGEHGDGQARGELLEKMYGPRLMDAFRRFKRAWDPSGKLNPGKLVDANPMNQNLRYRLARRQMESVTGYFDYTDEGGFQEAVNRCVGIGKCRQALSGTMCPSYQATLEEKYSPRGRARLLAEMFEGDLLTSQWRSDEIKEALDLCLSCKACKSECPTNVDIATYKSEFLAHYHQEKKRSFMDCLFAGIDRYLSISSKLPQVFNILTRPKWVRAIVPGLATQRKLPKLADQTFSSWFSKRRQVNQGKQEIILWPDTFNQYLSPEISKSAVNVLESLNFCVRIPKKMFCCGRPLYDFGMLEEAKSQLRKILESFTEDIKRGTPIIVLEPSCASVFRDEMKSLLKDDPRSAQFSKLIYTFAEFVEKKANLDVAPAKDKIVAHRHCHESSVLGYESEQTLLKRLGGGLEVLDSGCCGMAGAFGFRKENYEISVALANRVLAPKIKEASDKKMIVTNGFSCREQISQLTGKKALHVAQVLDKILASKNES